MSYLLVFVTLILTWPGDGSGSVVVEVTVHSYLNDPAGRCAECQPGPEAGCCDEDFVRPANETCPSTAICDPIIAYCDRLPGGTCEEPQTFTAFYIIDRSERDFIAQNSFLGTPLPLILSRDEPWNGLEFVLTPRDCTPNQENRCINRDSTPIDEVIITMDVPVGTRRPEQTYRGNAGLAQFNVSYSVRCAVDHYGADCTRECTNFTSCDGCGLPGFFGEFCQFPADNCSEVYCNGNGECEDGSPTCACEPGYTDGDRCEVDINECEGINCSGNGRCEDGVNSFECLCEPGYTGELCEDIDDCEGEDCSGNGRCEDGVNSFTCMCDPGYTGDLCEQLILTVPTNTTTSRFTEDQATETDKISGLAVAAIAGGVVGGIVFVVLIIIIVLLLFIIILQRKQNSNYAVSQQATNQEMTTMTQNQLYGVRTTEEDIKMEPVYEIPDGDDPEPVVRSEVYWRQHHNGGKCGV